MDHRNYMELSRKERKSGKRVDCIMNMHAHTLTHSSHVVVLLSFFFFLQAIPILRYDRDGLCQLSFLFAQSRQADSFSRKKRIS